MEENHVDPNEDLKKNIIFGFPRAFPFWIPNEDHKPEDPDERLRIEAQGGIVARQRVWPR